MISRQKFIHNAIQGLRFPEASRLLDRQLSTDLLIVPGEPLFPFLGCGLLPKFRIIFKNVRSIRILQELAVVVLLFLLGYVLLIVQTIVTIAVVRIEVRVLLRVIAKDDAEVGHPICRDDRIGSGFHQANPVIGS